MKHIILRIAGTFGSGKTTAVRQFLNQYTTEVNTNPAGKIVGYTVTDVPGVTAPIFVLGKYSNVCGGTDAISTQQEIADFIIKLHPHGHVMYEGALVSGAGANGCVTKVVQELGCGMYAFLDTPMELCISRVESRRASAGNSKPFNPKNLILKYESVVSTYKAFRRDGYPIALIDHTDPHPQLLKLISEYENA